MSNVLEIRFTSRSPVRSATIANAIIQSYIDGRLMAQRKERAAAASHLRERLAELQDKAFPADPPQDAPPQGAPPQGAPTGRPKPIAGKGALSRTAGSDPNLSRTGTTDFWRELTVSQRDSPFR